MGLARYVRMIRRQEHPVRFVIAQVLLRTGLCKFFTIPLEGFSIRFFPTNVSVSLWIKPSYRVEDRDFVRRLLRPGEYLIDVGANIGYISIAGGLAVGPGGRVLSLEPHPRTFGFLRQNIEHSGMKNVELRQVAAGETEAELTISDSKRDDMNALQQGDQGGLRVKVLPLDKIADNGTPVSLLKIDVEGFELHTLRGARQTLSRTETVYIEVNENNFRQQNYSTRDVLSELAGSGFELFLYKNATLKPIDVGYMPEGNENVIAARDEGRLRSRLGL